MKVDHCGCKWCTGRMTSGEQYVSGGLVARLCEKPDKYSWRRHPDTSGCYWNRENMAAVRNGERWPFPQLPTREHAQASCPHYAPAEPGVNRL